MVTRVINVICPHCGDNKVRKNGHNTQGKQVYLCTNTTCKRQFVEEYTYNGCNPRVRREVIKLSDCTGMRATSRLLSISKDTVTSILKKQNVGIDKSIKTPSTNSNVLK